MNCYQGPIVLQALKTVILVCMLLPGLLLSALAQPLLSPAPQARPLKVLDGIVLGHVNKITQSRNGLLWLATDNGLVRFDGFNATRFSHQPAHNHTLSHNRVIDIAEDMDGTLWVSTYGGGLNKFDESSESFTKVELLSDITRPGGDELLYQLTLDSQSIWIGSSNGVKRISYNDEIPVSLPFEQS